MAAGIMVPTILMPYLVVVSFTILGIGLLCVCFCVDLQARKNEDFDEQDGGICKTKKKKKTDKTQDIDIEMETFRLNPYSATGVSNETTFALRAPSPAKTPRVLRGSPAPWEDKGDARHWGMGAREKVLSGSRGGQSSWSYVNLAFEKDVDFILSPETLKRRREERTAGGERSRRRKDDNAGKSQKGGKEETTLRIGEVKTFGSGGDGETERKNYYDGEQSSTFRNKNWVSSNSWHKSMGVRSEEVHVAAGGRRSEEERRHDDKTADIEETGGFRLKQLTNGWDTERRGKGSKHDENGGGGSGREEGGAAETGGAVGGVSPRDYDAKVKTDRRPSTQPRDSTVLSSQFSTSTKLLLSPEEEMQETHRAATLERGYTTTLTRADRDGWREGQVTFFDHEKKREFIYFSAR